MVEAKKIKKEFNPLTLISSSKKEYTVIESFLDISCKLFCLQN